MLYTRRLDELVSADSPFRVSLTNGGIVSTCVVQIPQRYMTVNGMSSIKASAQFLALGAFVPIGTAFSVVLTSRLKIRSYIVVGAAVLLQIIGAAFLARASTDYRVQQSQYGMQVLVGTGVGLIIGTVLSMIPENMQEQDVGELAFQSALWKTDIHSRCHCYTITISTTGWSDCRLDRCNYYDQVSEERVAKLSTWRGCRPSFGKNGSDPDVVT